MVAVAVAVAVAAVVLAEVVPVEVVSTAAEVLSNSCPAAISVLRHGDKEMPL